MPQPRRPILYKGEHYSAKIERKKTVIPEEPSVTYEQAREKIIRDITTVTDELDSLSPTLKLPNESIVRFRLQDDLALKSFYPTSLFFPKVQSSSLQEVGSHLYTRYDSDTDSTKPERFFYIRTTRQGLLQLENKLHARKSAVSLSFQKDIRQFGGIYLGYHAEKVSVENDWQEGRLEVTLHPFLQDRSLVLAHFRELLMRFDLDPTLLNIKQYASEGLTFISMPGRREMLEVLGDYNPLRAVHPLEFRNLIGNLRVSVTAGAPVSPTFAQKSPIVVGVIDGGYKSGNPANDRYVDTVQAASGAPDEDCNQHGTLTTSAILYGPLNELKNTDRLPEPDISVRNFRVLPTRQNDPDLYEVIDEIERIVPANNDIQVYNLSLGPAGPILDTQVHRFTYALDLLSKKHNVLFNVAVGNDGDIAGYDRIQSPSDMVNGIGVGAFSTATSLKVRADYSCSGPGREGSKLKPDLLAFGGCDRVPIHLLGWTPNTRAYTSGTSFAAPLSSRMSAKLIGGTSGVVHALTAKALLIHDACKTNHTLFNNQHGHGWLCDDLDALLDCSPNSYTLIYEGELEPNGYQAFTIPWIPSAFPGKVNIKYTVAVQTAVDPNSPDMYTTSMVELIFYPHDSKYNFRSPNGKNNKRVDIDADPIEANRLIADGWTQSGYPVTESSTQSGSTAKGLKPNLRWDTVDVRSLSKMSNNIKNPSFQVHAMSRGHRSSGEKVKFAVILTVEAIGSTEDVYRDIIQQYSALVPLSIQLDQQVNVNIGGA